MTRARIVLTVGLIAGVLGAALPAPAAGDQRHHHRERRGSDRSRHDDRPGLHRRHHSPRPFVSFYSPPVVQYTYYTPPPVYYYYVPPVVYQAPPVSVPAPPLTRVIEYATGRYELRGDGGGTPYEWTWIPNPPSSPPPPGDAAAAPSASVAETPRPSREAFRWTDEHGVTTWTDRLESVPEQYRAHVLRLR